MSNTTLSDYPPTPDDRTIRMRRPVPRPQPAEYEEAEYEEEIEQPSGLFSTPGRTITVVLSMVMLVVIGVVIAWKLGEVAGGTTPNLSAISAPGAQAAPAGSGPKVGMMAPDFSLIDVNTDKTVSLSDLRGKPVWINFWGTWCPPCKAEMPEMQKIYQDVKDKVHMVGVSMGPRDEPAGVQQFVHLNNYSWQFIHDADSNVMNTYEVTGIPTSFFVDKNGIIRAVHVGGAMAPELQANLQKALDQQ